jgi:uroporphyrinogen decarboxylase
MKMPTEIREIKEQIITSKRQPVFDNILKICYKHIPTRATPFEFIINDTLLEWFAGRQRPEEQHPLAWGKFLIDAYKSAGYDYASMGAWHLDKLNFQKGISHQKATKSLNAGALITDRNSYDVYPWPEDNNDFSILEEIYSYLPQGMKLIVCGYEGILETAIALVGYENLCLMLLEDAHLTGDIFSQIGNRIYAYYQHIVTQPAVGAVVINDDWGFKGQTMLPPESLREYIFPWYCKIVDAAHQAGKPVILHSCGNLEAVMEDIIIDINLDGKHSFEDTIIPVEEAYTRWSSRIGIFGGIDINFLVTQPTHEIEQRVRNLIQLSEKGGGLAIGSGNSIPDYIPLPNYCALLRTTLF